MNKYILSLFVSASFGILPVAAQSTVSEQISANSPIVVAPLFEYPVAPEEITDLREKSNWILENFWSPFDFKNKQTVDQNALNHAFMVYCTPLRWADRSVALVQVDKLITQLTKNPTMLLQFTKAAEENLYGPRADMSVDEIYVRFLDAFVKNKKTPESRKARYRRQLTQLSNTLTGTVPPQFTFSTPSGVTETFRPGLLTVIEFGDPSCADCRYAKLKMNTNVKFSGLVEKGLINVLFIIPDPEDGWEKELEGYPQLWHVGASDSVSDIYDMRSSPTLYVIGTDGKILAKTGRVDDAINIAVSQVAEK